MQEYTFPEYKDWCLRSIAYVVSFGLFILGLGGGVLAQTDASFLANYSIDSNLTTVILALIAAVVTPVVTFVLKYVQDRNIAISSKEQTQVIADKADLVSSKVQESQKVLVQNSEAVDGKLEKIHVLVNSQMTAALQAELNAVRRELAMMRHVEQLNETLRKTQSDGSVGPAELKASDESMQTAERRIKELEVMIAERLQATETGLKREEAAVKREDVAMKKLDIIAADQESLRKASLGI